MKIRITRGNWKVYYYIVDTRERRVISAFRAPTRDVEIVVKKHRAVVRSVLVPKYMMYFDIVYLPPGASPREVCEIAARYAGVYPPHPDVPVKPEFLCD